MGPAACLEGAKVANTRLGLAAFRNAGARGANLLIVSNPKKPSDSKAKVDPSLVSELVQRYSGDKQLLQQAIKDLERRITYKAQQLAVEKKVLQQLLKKLDAMDKSSD